ncbi:MAG: gamma-glutamylcyclotransferase [Gammaproteobacteria bacterium]|jgi:hypothetical protein
MLRYLTWWLMFEICNCRRLLGRGPGQVQYFAYGANLSPAVMRDRRIEASAVRYFTLEDYGLRFDHPAAKAGCGYASAEPAVGESVFGLLYTLSERDAARMDFYEMVPIVRRYRRTWVEQGGERLYFYQTNRSTPGLKPTSEYLGYILECLASHPDVDPSYRERLAAVGTETPGGYVASYLAERPEFGPRWLYRLSRNYHKLTLILFRHLLMRFSLTAPFIRH